MLHSRFEADVVSFRPVRPSLYDQGKEAKWMLALRKPEVVKQRDDACHSQYVGSLLGA